MADHSGYHGPPRDPEAVVRAAFSNPELMRQLVASYEEELQGIPPVLLRRIQEELDKDNPDRRRTA